MGILRIKPYPVPSGEGLSARRELLDEATASGVDSSMGGDGLDLGFQRTPLLIYRDSVIQNGAAVNALPRMEDQEEV